MAIVMVTGGTGLIGSYAVRELLARGHRVVVFDLVPNPRNLSGVLDQLSVVRGDVTDLAELMGAIKRHQVERVLHLAAMLSPEAKEFPGQSIRVNCLGTANVFDAARFLGLERVCFTSTQLVYGPPHKYGDRPVNEDDLPGPTTPYGVSKLACEVMAQVYRQQFGLDVIAIRPTLTYGIGRLSGPSGGFCDLIRRSALGLPAALPRPFGADSRLQPAYARDVAAWLAAGVLAPPTEHGVFNPPIEEMPTVSEILDLLREQAPGADVRAEHERGEEMVLAPRLDGSRARRELGISQLYPLKDGLRAAMDEFRRLEG